MELRIAGESWSLFIISDIVLDICSQIVLYGIYIVRQVMSKYSNNDTLLATPRKGIGIFWWNFEHSLLMY